MAMYDIDTILKLRERIGVLEEELRQLRKAIVPADNPLLYRMSRQHASLLMGLYSKGIATYAFLDAIGSETGRLGRGEGEDYAHHRVKVAMHKLRKKLREHDIEFYTVTGIGYYLDDENKAKLKQMMEKKDGLP